MDLYSQLPPEAVKIVLVLFLSFLIGLEREEHKAAGGAYSFGGVRTFPLIGLIGYSMALISGTQLVPLTIGFLVVAGFLLLSYWHKLSTATATAAGVTTEMSGLATFLVGALVCYGHFWIATTLAVASLLLLDLKAALEKLATQHRAPRDSYLRQVSAVERRDSARRCPTRSSAHSTSILSRPGWWWWPSAPSPTPVTCCRR